MFTLSSNTSPLTVAPGVSSCIRLRQRSRVDLPQPDGPMMAVTICAGNKSDTSCTARWCPNSAVTCAASSRSRVLADATIALPGDPAGRQRDHEDKPHQHQRRRPGQAMPLVERAGRVHVDLQRERLHRLADGKREIEIAERCEEQRRGLTCDARDADEASRHDPPHRRARHDLERGAPARIAERQCGLPERVRHQADHLLRRARQHGDHEDGQRDAAGQCREAAAGLDDERPSHDADHDRRRAVQYVRDEAHEEPQPSGAILGEIHPGADADRHADQRREADHDDGSDNGVCDAAARLSGGHRAPGEERPVERRRTLRDQVAENEHQGEDGREREDDHQHGHQPAREVAAQRASAHRALLPTAAPRATRQIRMRATALTATVSTNRISPTSNSADRYMFVVASLNSLAIAAAIVYAGCSSETPMSWRLPITIVTAIVSPSARPRPRMIAPMRPARPYGSTAERTVSQRVAPIASAASRCAVGTARSTSRDTAAMYGTIMIARMMPPASSELP